MEDTDNIIVFSQFDSVIDANLAKSKLDAFGIPCFLTEENMAALYQQSFAIKVRLHLFEKDRAEAAGILFGTQAIDTQDIVCPACHSTAIDRDFPRKLSEEVGGALKVMFFGIFMPEKKVFRCKACDHEF